FPRPERLFDVKVIDGLAEEKVRRLHGLAEAALDGRLATNRLRSLAPAEALAALRELRGVGEFTAQGILLRGCGLVDELPDDALSDEGLETMYADDLASGVTRDEIGARWRGGPRRHRRALEALRDVGNGPSPRRVGSRDREGSELPPPVETDARD